jgi:SPP1 family predicted phage head-tail adaptor
MRIGDMTIWAAFDAPVGSVWVNQFTVKGSYWPLSSAESIAQLSLGGTVTGKVRIRYKPNVKILTSWRIRVNNSVLSIVGPPINLGGRNEWIEFKVKEVS